MSSSPIAKLPAPQRIAERGAANTATDTTGRSKTVAGRPLIGVAASLLGAIISTLDFRLTVFGLADLRGAVHAGFDEGAWIPTAFTVGQMSSAPSTAWLGVVFGPRHLLTIAGAVFAMSNLLLPLSFTLTSILAFQLKSGLASGTFVPLTVSFVVQSPTARCPICAGRLCVPHGGAAQP